MGREAWPPGRATKVKRIVAAAVLALVGVVLLLTAGSLVGVLFASVGLAVFGWAIARPKGRVVTGNKCAACAVVVTLEREAEICTKCDAGLHARCLEAHMTKEHGQERHATP